MSLHSEFLIHHSISANVSLVPELVTSRRKATNILVPQRNGDGLPSLIGKAMVSGSRNDNEFQPSRGLKSFQMIIIADCAAITMPKAAIRLKLEIYSWHLTFITERLFSQLNCESNQSDWCAARAVVPLNIWILFDRRGR
jgi:hypothetical protein